MICVNCDRISLSFGIKDVLNDISFTVQEGNKVGIVGVNGAGKSTLFKIIAGVTEPDSGNVYTAKGFSIGYLSQHCDFNSEKTLYEEMLGAFTDLISMENRLAELQNLADSGDIDASASLASLHEKFVESGGLSYQNRAKGILRSLGFSDEFFDVKISSLSGGQKTRVALARILLSDPDIIMLDEPTNHLDISSITWLEKHLQNSKKTLLLISHDRYFLCAVTNKTLEIENQHAKMYNGNYDYYVAEKKREREIQEHQYKSQQKEIARIEAYIEQQRRWNRERNIIAAESREKQLAKMERINAPEKLPENIRFTFTEAEESGNDVLSVRKMSKSYPGKKLFSDLSFEVKKRDRLLIIGENGSGKSTLLKILNRSAVPDSGVYEYGYNVHIGYYDQENQNLHDNLTVIDELWNTYPNMTQTEIRSTLALFLFKGDDIFKEISVLSGGEKARLTLCKLILSKVNLLILDEPTNHLDILSREVLENAIERFDGTIIAVSHDRYFINKIATRLLDFKGGKVVDYIGTYKQYEAYLNNIETSESISVASQEKVMTSAKAQYLASKQEAQQKRKQENAIKRYMAELESIEKELADIEKEKESDAAFDHVRLSELYKRSEELEERMLFIYEELDKFGKL